MTLPGMTLQAAPEGDPLDDAGVECLGERHPLYTRWAPHWEDFRLLYKGGQELLAAAGQWRSGFRSDNGNGAFLASAILPSSSGSSWRRPRRFLFQLEGEPDAKYDARWNRAFYLGYMGAIIDYFRHWLFSQPPVIRPVTEKDAEEPEEAPDWWDSFSTDCDGAGTDFLAFVREAFLDVLVCQRAGWMLTSALAEDEGGAARTVLTRFAPEDILDWQRDARGELEWVLVRKRDAVRQFPRARADVETFTFVDRTRWRSWQTRQGADGKAQLEVVGEGEHDVGCVPFVMLEVPEGLWPANKLASWQVDLFNQDNMLSYGELMSCFLQPYVRSHEGQSTAESRIMGEGIIFHLRCGQGDRTDEEVGWAAAPVEPLKFSSERIEKKRDEGYRIVHQMSLAVDSQAVAAVARSGASKVEDRRSTEVILCAYGGYVREALVRTLNLVSRAEGDGLEWSCDGYDNFQVSSLDEELATAGLVQALQIPSSTFLKELLSNIATGRILGHIDDVTRQRIRKEIEEAIDEQEKAKEMAGVRQVGPGQEPQLGPDGQPLEVDPETGEPVDADAADGAEEAEGFGAKKPAKPAMGGGSDQPSQDSKPKASKAPSRKVAFGGKA